MDSFQKGQVIGTVLRSPDRSVFWKQRPEDVNADRGGAEQAAVPGRASHHLRLLCLLGRCCSYGSSPVPSFGTLATLRPIINSRLSAAPRTFVCRSSLFYVSRSEKNSKNFNFTIEISHYAVICSISKLLTKGVDIVRI
jgi:hypothetical protein